MTQANCPVCGLPLTDSGQKGDQYQFDCSNCGQYVLSGRAKTMVKSRVKESATYAAVLSHALRRMQRLNQWPIVKDVLVQRIEKENSLPDPVTQAENFVLWLGESQQHPGGEVVLDYEKLKASIGAFDGNGVAFIVNSLWNKKLIEGKSRYGGDTVRLSFEGWQQFYQLTRRSSAGPQAFMAMDFKNPDTNDLYLNHLKPAVAEAGFDLRRLDEEPQAGSIDERLRVEIRRSRFVVADLTDANLGAYWEAGFAEGLGKPVIYTCERGVFDKHGTHFDTNHLHTVVWDMADAVHAAEELKATVRATLPEEARMNDPK